MMGIDDRKSLQFSKLFKNLTFSTFKTNEFIKSIKIKNAATCSIIYKFILIVESESGLTYNEIK